MTKKQDKKIMIVGTDDRAYQFGFLSMLKLKLAEVFFFQQNDLKEEFIHDLQYATAFFSSGSFTIGHEKDFQTTDIMVITANEKKLEEETDENHLRKNIRLIRKIIKQAMANGFNGIVLIATEPTDIFTYLIWKFSGLPKEKIFGLGTYIDSVLFQQLLSQKLRISPRDINAFIIGGSSKEHKIAAWSRSNVGGNSILSLTIDSDSGIDQEDMFEIEQKILEKNLFSDTFTSPFTTAAALIKLVQFMLTNEEAIVPLVHLANIEEMTDIPLALPVLLGEEGIRKTTGLNFSDLEKQELLEAAKNIRANLDWIEKG